MGDENVERAESLLSAMPIPRDEVISLGMKFFFSKQDPNGISLEFRPNGYSINVKVGDEGKEQMKMFWEEYIQEEQ